MAMEFTNGLTEVSSKETGKKNHITCGIKAVGKIIKWGRGLKFWGRNQDFKKCGWGRISS